MKNSDSSSSPITILQQQAVETAMENARQFMNMEDEAPLLVKMILQNMLLHYTEMLYRNGHVRQTTSPLDLVDQSTVDALIGLASSFLKKS